MRSLLIAATAILLGGMATAAPRPADPAACLQAFRNYDSVVGSIPTTPGTRTAALLRADVAGRRRP